MILTTDANVKSPSAIWKHLSVSCMALLKDKGAIEAVRGLEALDLDSGQMPSLEELNLRLRYVGWSVTPVDSFISSKEFLSNLANRILPISIHMREWSEIEFSAAPDYFHEAFGHVCLLANSDFRKFLQRYGEVGLKCFSYEEDDSYLEKLSETITNRKHLPLQTGPQIYDLPREDVSELVQLTRLGWWTFETGLIQQNNERKVWGAALISSTSELKSFSQMPAFPLTLDCVWNHFDPSTHQERYYFIHSVSQLNSILDDFENLMAAKSGGELGCKKAFRSKANCIIRLNDGSSMRGFIKNVDDGVAQVEDSQNMKVTSVECRRIVQIQPANR